MKLNDLVALLKGNLVGKENYERFGNEFPLLVKFIDAKKQLSIQVHPDDEHAIRNGLNVVKQKCGILWKAHLMQLC